MRHEETEIIFKELENYTPIISSKQYKNETGKEINNKAQQGLSDESCNLINKPGVFKNKTPKKQPVKKANTFIEYARKEEKERLSKIDINFPYIKIKVLTDAELQLFNFMKNNLCQIEKLEILTKVRLADIVNVDNRITLDKKYLWKITNKHVDFIICKKKTLDIICVVELDDYTHESEEAQEKDEFIAQVLKAAGIELVRIKTKISIIEKSDLEPAEDIINKALAPRCPYCGIKMVPRKSSHPSNKGHRFYGCVNYTVNCKYTIDIDPIGEKLP